MSKKPKIMAQILGVAQDARTFNDAPEEELVLNKAYIGLEIELENVQKDFGYDKPGCSLWTTHEDHSLRNNGLEFVFAQPLCGIDIITAVRAFCEEARRCKFEASPRTGIHVHVDIRDMTPNQLHTMLLAYAAFEKPLFNYIAPDRYTSNFCMPWLEASNHLTEVGQLIYGSDSNIRHVFERQHKYSALNLEAMMRLGTVEFRHMHTTLDPEAILTWINICLSLKKFAMRYDQDPQMFLQTFSMGPERLCDLVFGKYSRLLTGYLGFRVEAYEGMRLSLTMVIPYTEIYENYYSPPSATPSEYPQQPFPDRKYKSTGDLYDALTSGPEKKKVKKESVISYANYDEPMTATEILQRAAPAQETPTDGQGGVAQTFTGWATQEIERNEQRGREIQQARTAARLATIRTRRTT